MSNEPNFIDKLLLNSIFMCSCSEKGGPKLD